MAEFLVSGKVTLDTGPAAAGAKQVATEIERMSQSGIAGFEAAKQKVIKLTQSMVELKSQVLQNEKAQSALNDAMSTAGFGTLEQGKQIKSLNALHQTLTQNLQVSSKEFSIARGNMRGMSMESRETNEKVSMLAASLGVQLPMGLERLIARMPGVQSALGMAFNASIVLAVGAAIVSLFPKIAEWIDNLRGVKDVNDEIYKATAKLNAAMGAFGAPGSIEALTRQYGQLENQIGGAKKQVEAFNALRSHPLTIGATLFKPEEIKNAEKEIERLTPALGQLQNKIDDLKGQNYEKALDAQAKAAAEAAKKVAELNAEISRTGLYAKAQEQEALEIAYMKAIKARAEEQIKDNEAVAAGWHQYVMDSNKGQEEILRIADERQKREWEMQKQSMDHTREMAKAQEAAVEAVAGKIDTFIDRVFLQAKSIADVFHQFLMQMLGSLVKWASREIAAALLGMKQMAGQGGGGGILGALFGGLLGGGGSAFGGMTAGGGGAALTAAASGFAPGWGGGLDAGAITPLGGGIPNAAGGASTGLLGNLAFGNMKGIQIGGTAPGVGGFTIPGAAIAMGGAMLAWRRCRGCTVRGRLEAAR